MAENEKNKMTINVKLNDQTSVSVLVDPSWDVGKLKEEISRKKGIPKEEIHIIFQGRTLHDSVTIQVGKRFFLSLYYKGLNAILINAVFTSLVFLKTN